jgi:hypothetical protein
MRTEKKRKENSWRGENVKERRRGQIKELEVKTVGLCKRMQIHEILVHEL